MCFREISMGFQENLKDILKAFQGCFEKVSRVFQLRLKGISSSYKGVSRLFERSFKVVSRKNQGFVEED